MNIDLIEKPCKAGCEGCYYEFCNCPDQDSGKPVTQWSCVVKNCIYVTKNN